LDVIIRQSIRQTPAEANKIIQGRDICHPAFRRESGAHIDPSQADANNVDR
jgi:hypothetical protein